MSKEPEPHESPPRKSESSKSLMGALESERALRLHYEELLRSRIEQKAAESERRESAPDVPAAGEDEVEFSSTASTPLSQKAVRPQSDPEAEIEPKQALPGLEENERLHSAVPAHPPGKEDQDLSPSTSRNNGSGRDGSTRSQGMRPSFLILVVLLTQIPWVYFSVFDDPFQITANNDSPAELVPELTLKESLISEQDARIRRLENTLEEADQGLTTALNREETARKEVARLQAESESMQTRLLRLQHDSDDAAVEQNRLRREYEALSLKNATLLKDYNDAIQRILELENQYPQTPEKTAPREEDLPAPEDRKSEVPLPVLGKDGWVFPTIED